MDQHRQTWVKVHITECCAVTHRMLIRIGAVDAEQQIGVQSTGGRHISRYQLPEYSAPMFQIVMVGFILFLNPG